MHPQFVLGVSAILCVLHYFVNKRHFPKCTVYFFKFELTLRKMACYLPDYDATACNRRHDRTTEDIAESHTSSKLQ